MKSAAWQIKEYLRTHEGDFTSPELAQAIGISAGAVTGALSTMHKHGAITIVNEETGATGKRLYRYRVVDLDVYSPRESPGNGSRAGRSARGTTSIKRITDLLFSIIEDLERAKVGLEDYATDELLKELRRRTEK